MKSWSQMPPITTTPPAASTERTGFSSLLPRPARARLAITWATVAAFAIFGSDWLAAPTAAAALVCFVTLFAAILYAAFGVVHEADHLADSLGEPYGTLILTLSVVGIEVILIAAVMLGPGHSLTIARDSIFAVMMIILNLVTGLCLLLGGLRHHQQEYNAQGALSYLSMIALLTAIALVLPTAGSGSFSTAQGAGVAAITAMLYAGFLWLQMGGYHQLFIQPPPGAMIAVAPVSTAASPERQDGPTDRRALLIRTAILLALILPIILLADDMAALIEMGIAHAGAPAALGGVIIATIVFTPESLTAIRAAQHNQMQRAVNLCLGAFVSTLGLTIPAVLFLGLITGQQVVLGLSLPHLVLLMATVLLTTLTFLGQRTSAVQGLMHLALFAVYLLFLDTP